MVSQSAAAPRGRLRVSVPAHHLLLPLLPEFLERHPQVELDIDFNVRIVDLIGEGVDIAIRSGDLPDSRLRSQPLRHYRSLLCASPDYLARRGPPATVGDLADHDGIAFRYPNSGQWLPWPLPGTGGATVPEEPPPPLSMSSAPSPSPLPRLRRVLGFNNMEAVRGAGRPGNRVHAGFPVGGAFAGRGITAGAAGSRGTAGRTVPGGVADEPAVVAEGAGVCGFFEGEVGGSTRNH